MSTLRFWLVFLLLVAFSLPAAAEDDARLDEATQELIQEGIVLRRSGKDEAALTVFLEAEKRSPASVRVLLHVTTAAQATGRWLLAHRYLQKAGLYREDAYYQRYRNSIRGIEDAIAQHLGRLRVVGKPSGADVLVNGESVGKLPLAEPVVLEAGSYVLEVRNPGYFPLRRSITIATGMALSQESIALNRSAGSMLPVSAQGAQHADPGRPLGEPVPQSPWRARWISWTLAGTSAALLATSGVAFLVRENKAEQWNDDALCLDESNPTASRDDLCGDVHGEAKTAQTVGIVTGALGIGFGGAAVAHFLWSSEDHASEGAAARPSTACALGLGSLVCRGTF